MAEPDIPELDRAGLRKFGLLFGGFVMLVFGMVLAWLFGYGFTPWPWLVGVGFWIWAIAAPNSLDGFYRLWMRFAFLLNAIITRLVLGIVFYLVVWPIGILIRLRGRDPMRRGFESDAATYRIPSQKTSPNHMNKPF